MMQTLLLIAYIAIFVLQILLLISCIRKNTAKLWISLLLSELLPLVVSFLLMRYFDSLPGYGFMPGLTYFGEVFFSLGASALYGVVLFVSVCIFAVLKIKENKRQ